MAKGGYSSIIRNINKQIAGTPLYKAGGAKMLFQATGGDPDGAAFLAALAIKESSAGKNAFVPNNFWGWGVHAGPSVKNAPTVSAMARRVWEGLKSGPYYNRKGLRTSNQIMDVYAPSHENNTALYKQQNDQRMRAMLGGAYNPNTNIFAPGIGGQGGDAVIPARGPTRTAQGAGGGGAAAAPGVAAGGLAGSLQLDPATAKMIQKWIVTADRGLAKGNLNAGAGLWNKLLGRLRTLPEVSTPQGTAGGVPGRAATKSSSTKSPGAGPVDPNIPAGAGAGGKAYPILPISGATWGSYGYGDPEGQSGKHLAVDWFGKHGTPARAPVGGRIVRITPHSGPGSGQVFGGVLSIRGPDGKLYVMRHIDPLGFKVGQTVKAGQHVGTPTAWTGGSHHIHFEVYKPGSSDREYGAAFALNPKSIYG